MVARVDIDSDGGVSVLIDTSEDEVEDETSRRLVGLVLDDLLSQASATAIKAWLELHTEQVGD